MFFLCENIKDYYFIPTKKIMIMNLSCHWTEDEFISNELTPLLRDHLSDNMQK